MGNLERLKPIRYSKVVAGDYHVTKRRRAAALQGLGDTYGRRRNHYLKDRCKRSRPR